MTWVLLIASLTQVVTFTALPGYASREECEKVAVALHLEVKRQNDWRVRTYCVPGPAK